MRKLIEQQRNAVLQLVPNDAVRQIEINRAFDVIETEAYRFEKMLEHDATKIERAAAKLPSVGNMLNNFAAALRDYAGRIREGSQEPQSPNGTKIIVLSDEKGGT